MYWIIYGFFSVGEFWVDALFSKIPLYWEMKIILILWLQLPQFRVLTDKLLILNRELFIYIIVL
jgi:hypothetical protein